MIGNWVLHESTWNKWAYMEMKSPDDLNHLGNDKYTTVLRIEMVWKVVTDKI